MSRVCSWNGKNKRCGFLSLLLELSPWQTTKVFASDENIDRTKGRGAKVHEIRPWMSKVGLMDCRASFTFYVSTADLWFGAWDSCLNLSATWFVTWRIVCAIAIILQYKSPTWGILVFLCAMWDHLSLSHTHTLLAFACLGYSLLMVELVGLFWCQRDIFKRNIPAGQRGPIIHPTANYKNKPNAHDSRVELARNDDNLSFAGLWRARRQDRWGCFWLCAWHVYRVLLLSYRTMSSSPFWME